MARLPWMLLLHGWILRTRPARSAHAYQSIWTQEGSPLLEIARRQATALQGLLDARLGGPVRVTLGMRYGRPSIASGLAELRAANARRVLILPLYPQYSATTVGSVFDAVARELMQWRWLPELRFVNQYHDEPAYIEALAASVRAHWAEHGQAERLLLSFHGIPQDYFDQGDPYFCHCHKTARLLAETLKLPAERWALSFPVASRQAGMAQTLYECHTRRLGTLRDKIGPGALARILGRLSGDARRDRGRESQTISRGGRPVL
jgi:ferrochelatase